MEVLWQSLLSGALLLQVVAVDATLVTAVRETAIVLEPVDVHNLAAVTLALHVAGALRRVEVVDVSVGADARSKHVTAVTETDLTAVLQGDAVILLNRVREDVHHHDLVADGRQDVESTRMEGHSRSFFTDGRLEGHFELLLGPIPDADVTLGASHDELLAQTDVHARDRFVMEGSVDVLAQLLVVVDISAIEAQVQLEELVVAIDVIEDILRRVHHHLADARLFNADLSGYAHAVLRAVTRLLVGPVDFVLV